MCGLYLERIRISGQESVFFIWKEHVFFQEGICVPGQEFHVFSICMEYVFRGHCVLNLEGIMSSMSGTVFCIRKEYVSSIRNVRSSF
jgi:hypothetical protein